MAYIEELEKRLLFSADLPGADLALATHESPGAVYLDLEQASDPAVAAEAERHELVIIDARTPDHQRLIDGLQAGDERRFEILVLDAERSGIEQIGSALAGQRNLSAVHLVSHGGAGELALGSDTLDNHSLLRHAEAVAGWGDSLTRDADLLIYGCDLASTDEGQDFVLTLAQLTGADVAASDDLTGHESLGGDWELETATGAIETRIAVGAESQLGWSQVLAIAVDNTTTGQEASAANLTFQHTTAGADRLMLVGVSIAQQGGGETVQSVQYNGVGLDFVGAIQDTSDKARVEIWSMVAPPDTGPHNVSVTLTGTSHEGFAVGVTSFTGVDQTTPLGTFASNQGNNGSSGSLTSGSATGELVFGVLGAYKITDLSITPGVDQTEYWDSFENVVNAAGSTEAGAPSVTTSYSWGANTPWAIGAVSVRPVVNYAPVLTGANDLTAIDEDPVSNDGTLVSLLVSGQVSDGNDGALEGIAVVGVDNANGTWEYTTNGGGLWQAFGSPGTSTARLLAADADTSVRFVPDSNWNGTVTDGLDFHAWDRTSGTAGGTADLTVVTHDVRDEFSANSFAGDDGTVNWAGDWQELGESDGASSGNVRVVSSPAALRIGSGGMITGDGALREVDLSQATSATLTFDAWRSASRSATITLAVSDNGGTDWYDRQTWSFSSLSGTPTLQTFDLTPYMAADTQIRFLGGGEADSAYFYADNVKIEYDVGTGTGGETAFSTATASSSITVNPVNDPASIGGVTSGAVTEDGTLTDTGALTITDPDTGEDVFNTQSGAASTGGYGTVDLDAAGNWTYTLTNGHATVQALSDGETLADSFTAVSADGTTQVVSITITGANDAPSIGGVTAGAVTEDGTLIDTGALTISDTDQGEDVFTAQTGAASTSGYGTVDLNAAGNWTYTLNNANATVQALSGGETLADSFTAVSADGTTQVVSITITGANDAPSIGGVTAGGVSEDGTLIDTGALTISDIDQGEDVFTAQTAAASTSGYGTVDLDAAGNWTYTLNNANATVQALSGGETLADSFTAVSADGSTQVVSITITGANDAPSIGGVTTGGVSEDGTLIDTGALTITDTDDGEDVFTAQTGAASTSGYGTVDLNAAGNWTYTLNNANATVQALSNGETLADSFTAVSADGTTQVVSITITGANDAPSIGGVTAGAVTEDGTLIDTGALTISDTDDGEDVFTTQTGAASTSGYGTVDLNAAGNWTYTLNNANATVQALSNGETLADSFTAVSADGTTQVVSITITGANDAPSIGGVTAGAVTEDGTLIDTGALTISDTDDGEDVFTAQTGAASTSGYGTVDLNAAGNWTYTLNNANATVQALSGGETLADSFTAVSADGTTQVVSITITGANDAPSIGGTTSGAVTEDGTLIDTGALTISDTDQGEDVFTAQTGAASTSGYGTVDLNAAGNWTYTLNNANATVQALSGGETLADSFTAVSADGTTQVVSITITGANDAPSIGGVTAGAVTEDGTLIDTGALTISDTDDGEDVFTTQTGAASTSGYGTVDLNAAGNWTYTLNNANATVQALSNGETLADSFTAVSADGSTKVVNITITGADDAPVIGGDDLGAVSEDGTLSDTGALTISDTDDGEDVFTAQTGAASTSGYGTVDLDAAGNWTYTLTNGHATVQALSDGETLADSFTAVSADGSTKVVNITITGADDAPSFGGDDAGAVSEDGTLSDTGALTISDTDQGEDVFATQSSAASTSGYGTVDLDAAGNWTYTLTNGHATVQALSDGETLADSFTAVSADGSTKVVNITITGADDAPVIGGDDLGAVSEDGTLSDTGALTISDTDQGEDVFNTQTGAASTSGYGTVDLDASGNWTYTLTNGHATVQALSDGETLADSFTAVSADGSTKVVNITITGADDAPSFGGDDAGAVSEDGTLSDTGALTISDTDDGEDVFTAQTGAASTSGYGTVDLDAAGNWTYTLTNGHATVQALSDGETLADSFTAVSADGSTKVVNITITGAGDAPSFGGDDAGAVSEDGTLSDTGALTISDTDDGEDVFTGQTGAASTSGYGMVDLDAAGNWTYTLTNGHATVQALSDGETLADSFTAVSADGSNKVVNITITGADDAPSFGGDAAGAVSEDGTLSDSGALTISDTDDGEDVFATQTSAASTSGYGTVDLDAAGNWTYTLTNGHATVQALSDGETLADSFTAVSADGSTKVVNITITGADDAPSFGGDDAGAVSEDGTLSDTGALTISDTDDGEDVFTAQTGAASTSGYGTVDLDAAGNWTYTLTNGHAAVQALSDGETLADSFTAVSADGSTQVVNITITGADDAPSFGGDDAGAVSEDGTLSDTGALTISDTDDGEDVFATQTSAASTSGYGTVDLDAAGNWTYTLTNGHATVQALSDGETLADSFTAVSADGSTKVVNITITGAGDAPSFGGDDAGAVSEDGTLSDTGALTISDTDDGEDVFTTQSSAASTSGYGTVDLDAAGNWTYTLTNGHATVQALSDGETLADSFTAVSADGSTKVVNITITGAGDAPSFGGDGAGAVSEDGTLSDTGALTISDTDDGEDVFTAQTGAASTSGYGTVDLDAAGNWTYTLTNGHATVQALSDGETLADSFTAVSADGSTKVVNITITGADDAPSFGGDDAGAVSEDGTLSDTGALTISDTDDGEDVFATQSSAASTSGYGTVDLDAAGNWTYTLTNGHATVQALSDGETLADSFTAVSADGSTKVVNITITGADDAPSFGGDDAGAVSEDGTLSDTGALTISDTDDGEDVFATQSSAASTSGYGTVDLDAAGNWTYTLTNGHATVQALSDGETLADSFTAVSADGSTKVVNITITGADDAPSFGGDDAGAVSEDGTLSDTGALTISDTDDGEDVFTAQTGAASTSGYGTVDLDAAGNWTYTLTNGHAAVQALSDGETLADSFTAVSADGSTKVVNITITGADDAPSFGGDDAGAVSEDGTLSDTGALTISDTDQGEDVFNTQTGAASTSGYGTVDLDAAGNWTYTLTNGHATVQALSDGETLADSFTAVSADGSTKVVNITITGADDAPSFGGDDAGAVSEDGTLSDSGALTISDTDDGEDVFATQTSAASTSGYGTVDLDASGNWTYTLTNGHATVQALSDGETLADSFTAVSADGSTKVVNITITGADDAPSFGGDDAGAVSEDGTLSDSGALTISDTDDGEDVFATQTSAASTSGYGTVDLDAAGNWTYTLTNGHATVQALSDGETLADSFTAVSADGSNKVVNITITGADDAPSFGGDAAGAVSEDGTLSDSGALTISDTDDGEDVFATQTSAASTSGYGTVDLDAAGNWTYTLTNGHATVQALSDGETLADSFTAVSADGSTKVVNITITGADDAPSFGGDDAGAVSEDGTLIDTGALTISDTDDGEDVFNAQTGTASTNGYGSVDLDAAGNWTYTLDNADATVQALSAGETLADSFTAVSADGSTQVVNITITGSDDVAVIGGDATGAASEDGTLIDSGALTISDTDDGEDVFNTQTGAASTGGYGSVDLDAAGNWTYTLDNANATVQALSAGEPLVDSFTAVSAGGTTQVVTITITGADDAPVIGGDAAGSVTEDGTLVDTGALTISDTDDGEDQFNTQSGAASINGYGSVDLDAAGNWTYTLDNANATVQALSAGEPLVDAFFAISADGTTQVVTITITGADDAPVIGGDVGGAVTEDGTLVDTGTLSISDTDDGEDVFNAQTGTASTGGYGSVDLDAAGNWTYTLDNADATVQALSAGETLADSFTAVSADGTTQVVNIIITGADDAAVIGGDTSGTVSEDGTLVDTGALTISDTDDGEDVFATQSSAASTNAYGTVDLDAAGNWTYTLDNAHATVQALSAGEPLVDTFTAVSAGGTTQVVTITITGADDAPVIGGDVGGAVTEDGTLVDTGALTISDTDDGEDQFNAQTGTASTNGYGSVDLDAAGNWTYTLDNADATVQALSAGETLADSFTAVSADGSTQVVNITITGSDDVAVIGGDATGAASEDGTLIDSGALTISDTDDGEDVFNTQTGAASTGGYGSVDLDAAGNWTYTLDNANATVQALSAGEPLVDSFTAVSAGGTTQVVTITITGADDAPVIGGDAAGSVTEDGTLVDTGALTISDTDDGEDQFNTQSGAASINGYGSVDLDAAGNWTYTLDNANATVQALSAGEPLVDAFFAISADGTTQVVTITITGADDAPVIGGDTSGAVTEDGTLVDTGALTISDTDDGEDQFNAQSGAASINGYGSVDLDAAGNWTYTLDNADATVQALSAGETLADSFTAVSADGSTQVVNITITGSDDVAVIGGDTTGAASEDGTLIDSGALTISDTDDGEDVFNAQAGAASTAGYGSVDLDAAGNWTYTLDNAHATVQALSAGEPLVDTFTAVSAGGTTQVVTITITGADDAPVIGGDVGGAVTEDGTLVDTGALTISDTDDGEDQFNAQTGTASINGYGSVDLDAAGNWTYTLDNADATVQALSAGETLADSFTAVSADGSTQVVNITITGSDDVAVIGGDTTGAASEDGTLTDSGALTISDTDDGEDVFATQSSAASTSGYGTVDLDAAGNWSYTLNNGNATVQALSAGEPLVDTFTAVSAGGTTQVVTITITGADDAPSFGGDDAGAVSEDGTLIDTGALTITDTDDGEDVFATQSSAASTSGYGTVDLDASGNWTYTLTNGHATVQALSDGETLADSFTAVSADGSTKVVNITITGADDAPSFGGDDAGAVSEDGTPIDTGALTISDTDDGEDVFATQSSAASTSGYGTVDLDAAGNWTYTLTNGHATVQALSDGETLADSFTAVSADGSTKVVNITITGADDAPSFGGDDAGAVSEDGTLIDTGALTISDTDDGEDVFATQSSAASTSGYGTVDLDAAGNWTYTLNNANATVQALSDGETLADSFTAVSVDGSSKVVNITITGANDAPSFGGDDAGAVSEDGTLIDTGALTINDTDDGEDVFATQSSAVSTSGYGTVDLDAAGNWTYTLNNANATVQALSDGETLADSFTAVSADGSTKVVNITITGADDAPSFGGDDAGAVSEDGTLIDTGALTITDTDQGEDVFTTQTGAGSTSGYGTVDLDAAGNWTYTLDNANATVQALSDGETLADSFTAVSADGSTKLVTITITGANDAPSFGGDDAGAVSEDGTLIDSGALTISDTDDGEDVFATQSSAASTNGYGTVDLDAAGNWTYTLNNANATVQALSDGETLADSFTAVSADGSTKVVNITITGADDAPSFGGDDAGAVSEDGTLIDTGALTISDTDDGEDVFATQTGAASTSGYGTVDLDAAGNWTYALNNANATVQALSDGETLADSFTAVSADGSTKVVNITITGADDAPSIGGDTAGAVNEDGALVDTGALTITDTDDGEDVFTAQTGAASTSGYGTVDLDASGNWTYTLNNANATVQALSDGESLADSFTAVSADGSTQVVSITITGANDAPVIGSDGGGANASVGAQENQTGVTTVVASDVDNGATLTYAISGGADAAMFSIDAGSGVLTFNAAPDFETRADADGDGVYEVVVQVIDSLGGADAQALGVQVLDQSLSVPADQVFTSVELASDGQILGKLQTFGDQPTSFVITGGDSAAAFAVDALGRLSIADVTLLSGGSSSYQLQIEVSDGTTSVSRTVTIGTERYIEPDPVEPPGVDPPIVPPPAIDPPPVIDGVDDIEDPEPPALTPVLTTATEPGGGGDGPVQTEETTTFDADDILIASDAAGHDASGRMTADRVVEPVPLFARMVAAKLLISSGVLDLGAGPTAALPFDPADDAALWASLDVVLADLDAAADGADDDTTLYVEAAGAAAMSLTVGFVVWVLRSGALAASLLSASPLWRQIDPLPVLGGGEADSDDDWAFGSGDTDEGLALERPDEVPEQRSGRSKNG